MLQVRLLLSGGCVELVLMLEVNGAVVRVEGGAYELCIHEEVQHVENLDLVFHRCS